MRQLATKTPSPVSRTTKADRIQRLRDSIEHAAHLLPAQGPITAFVHHNTLHAYEDLAFEQAVVRGGQVLSCHPFLPEERYRRKLAKGRIRPADIAAALIDDLGERGDELLGFLGTRFHLRMAMLEYPLLTGPSVELRWYVAETDALRRFRQEAPRPTRDRLVGKTRHWVMRDLRNGSPAATRDALLAPLFQHFSKDTIEQWTDETWEAFTLHMLWLTCCHGVRQADVFAARQHLPLRHAALLQEVTGENCDRRVNDVLIRFCSAFLDQGFADWPLRNHDEGFYQSFLSLYGQPWGLPDRWMRGLRREFARLAEGDVGPLESITESLELLGVDDEESDEFILHTLLALRGYAGMIWQLETRGDRVARPAPPGSLVGFLAVRLILERFALAWAAKKALKFSGPLDQLRDFMRRRIAHHAPVSDEQRAFLVFQLAQLLGWEPSTLYRLSRDQWTKLLEEIEAFNGLERRRIYHLAFERHYRQQTLDAVAVHSRGVRQGGFRGKTGNAAPARRPSFQVVCCIDEREESFRRHLEESAPDCETFGVAGFFAVAMYYRGAADAHYTPLCPVIIKPQHYVGENVVFTFEQTEQRRRRRRRTIGTVTHRVHVGSRTFAGGWFAALFGALASIPLVTRILFPRATAQLRRAMGGFVRTPAVTQLQLERSEELPGQDEGHVGFSVKEMAAIVERLLRDMGLTRTFSRIVVICGHGSSSLNNPHEAAHDCGACGGGRGGPNARAFAQMANDPRVRAMLGGNGLSIPADTVFVGAYHNTCDDSITYYDLDRLPSSHVADFERTSRALDVARERSAHERCRRFESAELKLSTEAALRHVEGRAEDLSQVRPEYGHATNALCFVGKREWSRGLFIDRRAFLQSYDSSQDDEQCTILARILSAVIPVCAGINLEYYFSYVDPTGYGCGTKLPHNIAALLGVMNGAASDLRPGLPWQMVEIHEPVRLLFVIETTPAAMLRIMEGNEGINRLVRGRWVQLATLDPDTSEIHLFRHGAFEPYTPESDTLPEVVSSIDWYRGWRDHLSFASVKPADISGPAAGEGQTSRSETSSRAADHDGK